MISISVLLLTHNEEIHIGRAIQSVLPFASRVIIVDSYSTDNTVEIAKSLGASVLFNRWRNYSDQFQWGLENAGIDTDWVMRLDADEVIDPPLAAEIAEKLPMLARRVVGVDLKRKHIFSGKWIKHGGRYPLKLTRIWRNGCGRIEERWMDEHIIVWGGDRVEFTHPFSDINLNDLGFFTEKHNKYATREAVDVLNRRYNIVPTDESFSEMSATKQAFIKRLVKENIYNRIPFQISTLGYFIYRYLFQLGFLDGREGLIYHFLQGYWYRFLVGAKVWELDKAIKPLVDAGERREELKRLTGLSI